MSEVKLKTHLIVSDVHDEYIVKWCGKIIDTKPLIKNGLPVFVIVSSEDRLELNTIDIKYIEQCAKKACHPRGRASFTSDTSYIYIVEEDGKETLMGKVIDNHIKQYQQMYDKFETI